MDAFQLKEYIVQNDTVPIILDALNCNLIKKYKTEYRCALPHKSDSTAVCVKIDSLKTNIYKKNNTTKGDIITLVMDLKECDFIHAIKELHAILGLKFSRITMKKNPKKYDPLSVFKKVKNKANFEDMDLQIYDEKILENYITCPNIWFFKEGISLKTQEKFNIGFCKTQNRITIPHRFWSGDKNDYIGIMGRTVIPDYEILNIPKYFPLLAFPKSLNLYGLQENYPTIQKSGIVLVFESEKSVMKMDTWQYPNSVAIGGKELTQEHIKILTGLNVDICFAFDVGIPEEYSKYCCDMFKHVRNTSYIFDKDTLLSNKMSPVDRKRKTFDYLFKNRIKYSNLMIE